MSALRLHSLAPLVLLAANALAQQPGPVASVPQKVTLHIAPQPVQDALSELGRQTGLTVTIQSAIGQAVMSDKLDGDYTLADALDRLLAHTGLHYEYLDAKTVAVLGPSSDARRPGANQTEGARGPGALSDGLSDVVRLASASEAASENAPGEATNGSGDVGHTPEILVRGSRVMNVDVKRTEDDVQPYHIFDTKQIVQSGAVNVEDFLKQQLTMNTNHQSHGQVASALGNTSQINLRGLGTNETLVLIDGRRTAGISYGGTSIQPDINGIPLSAIERIEVLPSSASAIYGGAAMGGVVNVILKKNYKGGEVAYTFDNVMSGHAPINTVNASYGFSPNDGKTRVMLSGQYSDATPLLLRDRPAISSQGYAAILARDPAFFSSGPSQPLLGATPNIGSADGRTNLTYKGSGAALGSPIATIAPGASATTPSAVIPGHWNTTPPQSAQYDNGLLLPLGVSTRTKTLMASVRQELGSSLEVFTEFSTASNSTSTVFDAIDNRPFLVPATSPSNPFNQDVKISFPNTLESPYTTDSVTQSATIGLLARLSARWNAEVDYTWSRSLFENATPYAGDSTALSSDLANGVLNPFVDTLAHPLNLAPYIAGSTESERTELNDIALRASGPLPSLPWGQPTLTIGLEHRREAVLNGDFDVIYPLTATLNSDRLFFGQAQFTDSVYGEAEIPLVTQKNTMPLIRSLELQVAGRSERYSVHTGTPFVNLAPDGSVQNGSPPQGVHRTIDYTSTNPTVGFKYRPVDDLTLRISYAQAFLPPTARQFLPNPTPSTYRDNILDPKNGQTYAVREINGGNPGLQPQTAKDWDFGLIWEPQEDALKGLRVDIEYYKIVQPNYITNPAPQQVVSNPVYASRVTRDPVTGSITTVDVSYVNATKFKTDGWDFKVGYTKPTRFGTFELRAAETVIVRDERQYTIGGPSLNYVGFPTEGGEARIKANATLSWSYRQWILGWAATYFGSYEQSYGPPNSPYAIQYGPISYYTDPQGGYSIASQVYHDLFGSYALGRRRVGVPIDLKIQFGIKNLFNKAPPFDAFYGPFYYSPYGDPRMRDYRLGFSMVF